MNHDAMNPPADESKRELATVELADGTLVPRYGGGMPYGGMPQPGKTDENDAARADQ